MEGFNWDSIHFLGQKPWDAYEPFQYQMYLLT